MKSEYERTGRLQRKIDIFVRSAHAGGSFKYVGSTNWHHRCKDAIASVAKEAGRPESDYRARFARNT